MSIAGGSIADLKYAHLIESTQQLKMDWEYTPQHMQIPEAPYWIKEARCRKEHLLTIPYSTINKISSWKYNSGLLLGVQTRARDYKDKQISRVLGRLCIFINILFTRRERKCAISRLRFTKLYALITVYFTICNYILVIQVLPEEKQQNSNLKPTFSVS